MNLKENISLIVVDHIMQVCRDLCPSFKVSYPVVTNQMVIYSCLSIAILCIRIVKAFRKNEIVVSINRVPVANDQIFRTQQTILFS